MGLTARLWIGGALGIVFGTIVIGYLSSGFMALAERATGDAFAWPQISFMSAYPADIRNGYFMFVAAVLSYVVLSSGVAALILGASPGKALFGVTYTADDKRAGRVVLRALIILLLVAFVLLAGPVLGFVFGPSADLFSLVALALGVVMTFAALGYIGGDGLSWVNRRAGVRPVLRGRG